MAKKSFINKDNPVMNFISQPSIEAVDGKPAGTRKPPEGYKLNPEFIETRSKRVQMLIQPSLHRDAKRASEELGISLNDFIHRAIQEATYSEYVREQIKKDLER